MKRGKPLRSRSAKRELADAQLDVARELRRRQARDWCEGDTPACRPGAHRGHHAHHVRTRARGGGHDVENLRWLCWDAHDWVHAHPAEATERGLLA